MSIYNRRNVYRWGVIAVWLFFTFSDQLRAQPAASQKFWIFFKDKGQTALKKAYGTPAALNISAAALARRAKMQPAAVIDWYDWPVAPEYLRLLESYGIQPVQSSRWLNAVSARLTAGQRAQIQTLPWVQNVTPVLSLRRPPVPETAAESAPLPKIQAHEYDYGLSLGQNQMLAVPEVHDLQITGVGVRILILDSGFNVKLHAALAQLKVLAEYDFVNNDAITQNEANQDVAHQHNHGTETLAVIAGYQSGYLIGPAFAAEYLLGKTEDVQREVIIEEDRWVAALEWGERLGADILSSSLGYNDWYTYENFDGNTAITTQAADLAVKKGMVVINSMGNEGNRIGSIIAPADGDSVIAVGAVTPSRILASFSSIGPTWDQRIKPDVVAQGTLVRTISPNSIAAFIYENGTSFSCPQVAGVAALILSARPELTPMQVRDALRLTAGRAQNPDNSYGWGIVHALKAVLFHGPVFSNLPQVEKVSADQKRIKIKVHSQSGINPGSVTIYFGMSDRTFTTVPMLPTVNAHEYAVTFRMDEYGEQVRFYFTAVDSQNNARQHPFTAPQTTFETEGAPLADPTLPTTYRLFQNYPNPFSTTTVLRYHLPEATYVELAIYNLQQQLVRQLVQGTRQAGRYYEMWDGTDSRGRLVATGTYQAWFRAQGYREKYYLEYIRLDPLKQNHPNPFNQGTRISYDLDRATFVSLTIFNSQGKLVRTLQNEFQNPGAYKLFWDGQDADQKAVSSGIYFYRLQTSEVSSVRKMTLLR